MPGVPSSRACDACRAQRKRCNQKQPACDRCERLRIKCTGAGVPRYKFQEYKGAAQSAPATDSETGQGQEMLVVSRSPSNEMTRLTSSLVEQIGLDDPRYNLCLACGYFLRDIPQRLGHDSTLDAAVDAFTAAIPHVLNCKRSPQMLRKYGIALSQLRTSLGNPATSRTASTLCAIYLIWICQAWIAVPGDEQPNHAEGLGQLLNPTLLQAGDGFGERVLGTIVPALLVESILNPKVQIPPWLKQWCECMKSTIEEKMPGDEHSWAWVLGVTLRMPDLIRFDPELLHEAKAMYHARVPELRHHRRHLVTATTVLSSSSANSTSPPQEPTLNVATEWHARRLCLHSLRLAMSILLNTILRAYDPNDKDLVDESADLAREIITMAKQASIYRPLGAAYTNFCLSSAWTACGDTDLRIHTEIQTVLADYQRDFLGPRLMDGCRKMMAVMQQLRTNVTRWRREPSDVSSSGSFGLISHPAVTSDTALVRDVSTTKGNPSVCEPPDWRGLAGDTRDESLWQSNISRQEPDFVSAPRVDAQSIYGMPSLTAKVPGPHHSDLQHHVLSPSPFPKSQAGAPLFVGTLAAFVAI